MPVKEKYHIAIVSPQVVGIGQTPETYSSQQINLALCWADAGHRVDVITGRCKGLAEALAHERIRLFEKSIFRLGGISGMPLMLGGCSELIFTEYDMVFSSEHYQPATFLSCLLSKNVVIYQGQNTEGSTPFKRLAIRSMERLFLHIVKRRYRKVVSKTQAAENFMRERGFEKTVTVPCGYDATRYRPPNSQERRESRISLGFTENKKIMVYAGNLLPRRNVVDAIEACVKLRANGTDAHLIVVGQGPEIGKLIQAAEQKNITHAVHFKGHLNWLSLRKVYWAGDIFVFPTQYEIFGLVLMEALACGLRIVSTPCPAALDILSACPEAGLSVPVKDATAIASACNKLFYRMSLENSNRLPNWLFEKSWKSISDQIIQSVFV